MSAVLAPATIPGPDDPFAVGDPRSWTFFDRQVGDLNAGQHYGVQVVINGCEALLEICDPDMDRRIAMSLTADATKRLIAILTQAVAVVEHFPTTRWSEAE